MVRYGQVLPGRKETWSRAKLTRAWIWEQGAIFRCLSTTMDMRFDRGEGSCYNSTENLTPWECVLCLQHDESNHRRMFYLDREVVAKRKNGSFSARVRNGASVFLSMSAIF